MTDQPKLIPTVQPAEPDDAIVAYRSRGGRLLRCLDHAPEPEGIESGDFHPVTSEELPDGGICTWPTGIGTTCGVDVLIAPAPQLRDQIAAAIRGAACSGDCDSTEEACARQRIQPIVWHWGVLAEVSGSPEMFADAVLAYPAIQQAQADLDRCRDRYATQAENALTEIERLTEARDALRVATGDRDAYDQEQQQLRERVAWLEQHANELAAMRDAAVEQAEEGQAALEMYGLWQRRAENARRKIEQVRAIPRLPHSSQQTGELGRAYTRGWESAINAIDTAVGRPQEQGECRRCHCPAGSPDCTHCNCCDVPDPQPPTRRDR